MADEGKESVVEKLFRSDTEKLRVLVEFFEGGDGPPGDDRPADGGSSGDRFPRRRPPLPNAPSAAAADDQPET